mmetsp:Transcript_3851/g.4987  ORF Transcript_3851/g.4987 Transcript_3851/m.4987 type:complete len:87 (-) Transcript_3851:577-837(-)
MATFLATKISQTACAHVVFLNACMEVLFQNLMAHGKWPIVASLRAVDSKPELILSCVKDTTFKETLSPIVCISSVVRTFYSLVVKW